MLVSVITHGLAVRNPINYPNTNVNQFVVKYYNWHNTTTPTLSPTSNNNYCYLVINANIVASSALSYSNYNYDVNNFNYITYPHQRYYLDTPFNSLVHRAPF
jgi:hypothetical protein